jgi:hypothetical protein
MSRPNVWTITDVGGGRTRIIVEGLDPRTSRPMGMGDEFSQDQIRHMVQDLCRAAGLPEPWKKG